MKRLVASAAVVFLSAVVTVLSMSACRGGSEGEPPATVALAPVSTTHAFASATPATVPEPLATTPPAPTAATPPSQPLPSRDLSLTQQAGDLQVMLLVSPGRVGYNEISLYFFDPAGVWISVQAVEIRITFLDLKSATVVETVSPLHPGHAFISGDYLRHGGRWQIEATFKRRGLEDAKVTFEVVVR